MTVSSDNFNVLLLVESFLNPLYVFNKRLGLILFEIDKS